MIPTPSEYRRYFEQPRRARDPRVKQVTITNLQGEEESVFVFKDTSAPFRTLHVQSEASQVLLLGCESL